MTKDQVSKLIEKLADKTLSFGCRITNKGMDCAYGHNIPDGIVINIFKPEGQTWDYLILDSHKSICMEDFECCGKSLGHQVLLGDVLEYKRKHGGVLYKWCYELASKWIPCGVNKSLQEIERESGYGWAESAFYKNQACSWKNGMLKENAGAHNEKLKDPNADALFTFLDQIFKN